MLTAALAIHAASLGLVKYPPNAAGTGVPCYTDVAPPTDPSLSFVVIYDRAGFPNPTELEYATPELQVIVRRGTDGSSRDCKALLDAIVHAVARPWCDYTLPVVWAPSTQDAVTVTRCGTNDAGPVPLGPDQIGRPGWSRTIQLVVPTTEA